MHVDHNVYILGAGFSRDAGLPLMADFLIQMRDSLSWLLSQDRNTEVDSVNKVLDFRRKATSAAYWVNLDLENIEELFSLAAAMQGDMDRHIRCAIASTIDFARKTRTPDLATLHTNVNGPSTLFSLNAARQIVSAPPWIQVVQPGQFKIDAYTFYVARLLGMLSNGKLKGENTFITFNYDTVLEDALNRLQVPFTYTFNEPPAASVPVLKLHGSVNWGQTAGGDGTEKLIDVFSGPQDLLSKDYEPALIPPTWKKSFSTDLQTVWANAVGSLSTATRVIIIGFSMPATDIHFKYLMAAGLQNNNSLRQILFVNPDTRDELQSRARELLRGSYIDSNIIDFERAQLSIFARGTPVDGKIKNIDRPCDPGVSMNI